MTHPGNDATLTEKWPALVSGAIGIAVANAIAFTVSVCNCLTAQQTGLALQLANSVVAVVVMVWQFKNMWSKASVEKVAAVPRAMTIEQAEKMVEKP